MEFETDKEGYVTINFNGLVVRARPQAIREAVEILENQTDSERESTLKSVESAIQINANKAAQGSLSEKDRKNLCDDIAIWFAGQVRTGEYINHAVSIN